MFFDLPDAGERALLVHCFSRYEGLADASERAEKAPARVVAQAASEQQEKAGLPVVVEEFVELVKSSGVTPVYIATTRRDHPTPRYFIGSGKVEELASIICQHAIDVVLFNHQLSPSQERNLETQFQCKVLDRTGLILDIFAQRAKSHVGKLQVELAQLEHISTRLVRGWTHLERQKGGIGLRGPGESQLETDRRLLRERIKWINKRLLRVNAQRHQGRRARSRAAIPTVSLVGYTNAGKSTLFNALTTASVYAHDQLFATLDTTLRTLALPAYGKIVLADTVGFVRDLPHRLVEAFKATLEEAAEADLLLHVVDASAEDVDEHIRAVDAVLAEIGADEIPMLLVMNKIDQCDHCVPRVDFCSSDQRQPARVWVSAKRNRGLDALCESLTAMLADDLWEGQVTLQPAQARSRARLYALGAVVEERIGSAGEYILSLRFARLELSRICAEESIRLP